MDGNQKEWYRCLCTVVVVVLLWGGDVGAQGDLTSVQAVEAIVSTKQKERLAEVEKKKVEVAAKHDGELQRAAQEHQALHEDKRQRKARSRAHASTRAPGCLRL